MSTTEIERIPRAELLVAHGYALLSITLMVTAIFALQPARRIVPLLTFLGFMPFLIPVLVVGLYSVLFIVGRTFSYFWFHTESTAQTVASVALAVTVAVAMLVIAVA